VVGAFLAPTKKRRYLTYAAAVVIVGVISQGVQMEMEMLLSKWQTSSEPDAPLQILDRDTGL
jgi:hypothetical protein